VQKKNKLMKLTSELIGYCYDIGMKDINVNIKQENDKDIITIQGEVLNLSDNQVKNIRRLLNTPREGFVEEYYWELIGESGGELSLAGMLIDEAMVSYENNYLQIILYRKE